MPGRVASPWPRRATCTGCRVCSDNDPGSRHRSSPPVLLGSSLLAAPFPLSGRVRRMSAMWSGIGRFLRWAYLRAIRLSTPCFSSSLAKLLILGDPLLGATDSLLPRRIVPWQRHPGERTSGGSAHASECGRCHRSHSPTAPDFQASERDADGDLQGDGAQPKSRRHGRSSSHSPCDPSGPSAGRT